MRYNTNMSRKSLSFFVLSPLLTLSLGAWILTTALHQTIGNAADTKTLLHQSDVYKAVIPSEIAQAQQDNPSLQGYPLNNPQIQKALTRAIGPDKIQSQGDQAVDSIYNWLAGKVPQPQFIINVMPDRTQLATSIGNLIYRRASSLPTCTSASQIPADISTHPFDATCLPPGITPEAAQQLVEGEINTNPDLSTYAPITANDVTMPNGKPVFQQFSTAPKWYQRAQWLPMACGAAALFFILLIILAVGPLHGARVVSRHLLGVGITLAACAALITWGIDWAFRHYVPSSSNVTLSNALLRLTSVFDAAYRNHILRLSAYMAGAGAVLYVIALVARKIHHHAPTARPAKQQGSRIPAADSLESQPSIASFTPAGPPALPATTTPKSTHKKSLAKKKTVAHKKTTATRRKKKA